MSLNNNISFLRDKYESVEAIILHGSRASGYAQLHSDWDFIVLVTKETNQRQFRANIGGEEIEFIVQQLPIPNGSVVATFGSKLRHSLVVFDSSSKGADLLQQAKLEYAQGIPERWLSDEKVISQKGYLKSNLNGMKDNVDNPAMFLKKLSNFYPRIINAWYFYKQRTYSDNLYIAIPYIKEVDPKFSKELEILYSFNTTPMEKIDSAEKLFSLVFS